MQKRKKKRCGRARQKSAEACVPEDRTRNLGGKGKKRTAKKPSYGRTFQKRRVTRTKNNSSKKQEMKMAQGEEE